MSRIEFPSDLLHEMRDLRRDQVSDSDWIRYGDTFKSYENSMQRVLHGQTLTSLLEGNLDPVIIDLMAPHDMLIDLFLCLQINEEVRAFKAGEQPRKIKGAGIAVCYEDKRNLKKIRIAERMGIAQIIGDIRQKRTWKKITEELAGRKAHLILERAWGGLHCLPRHPLYYVYVMNCLWDMLDENGTAVLQVPTICADNDFNVTEKWIKYLNREGFQVLYNGDVLYLKKTSNAPEYLPFYAEILNIP